MYILLAALAVLSSRTSISAVPIIILLAALLILSGAAKTWIGGFEYHEVYWRSDVRGASILLGGACFHWLRDPQNRPMLLGSKWVPIAAISAAIALNLEAVSDPIKYSAGTLFLALSLSLLPRAPWWFIAAFQSPILTRMGIWSYSVYLWQQPFSLTGEMRMIHLPIVFGFALANFYAIEQPARRALNQLRARPSPASIDV